MFFSKVSSSSALKILVVFAFICLTGIGVFKGSIAQETQANSVEKPPIYRGNTGQKTVALMINVDWGEEYIPGFLQILEENQVRVTFMVTGRWANLHPELIQQIAAAGHEIGNHGYKHSHPNQLGRSELQAEIQKTNEIVNTLTGQPTRVYAPPYGEFNDRVLNVAAELGYPVILWSLDTVDWKKPAADTLVNRVKTRIKPDDLVLMHPTEPTRQALPEMIHYLKANEFSFCTVSEIIAESGEVN